ncbi:MAG TPA: right-handed parallel beta-helix repeat-containing protein, partial [Thermoplasmata archaeon]|nr:right-handed parallel beta-helix repeat-containing protein [Thermoplasmata archaeon]
MSLKILAKATSWPMGLVLLLSLFSGLSGALSPAGAVTPHDPIFISGNADFTASNGVTAGTGTAVDPYIIEGWDINASMRVGFVIQNTDAHVRVRNVTVHDGGPREIGFILYNVKNVVLERVRSVENRQGIEASGVDGGLTIENSYFAGNGIGILLWRATGIVVRNNTFVGDGIAFIGNAAPHFSSHEIVGNSVNGRPLFYYHRCSDLVIDAVTAGQVVVADCSRVTISRLVVSDTDVGIVLAFVDHVVLRQNTLTGRR